MKKIFTSNSTGRWIIFWTMVCSALINNPTQANNIRINAPVKVFAGTGDTLVLEFPLQWDNSWRDEFNWDAAWVFLKYKVGSGDWKHVPLSFGGHSFNGSSGQPVHFDYMPGQTGSNTLGLFVYRSKSESGNTPEIICKLKCLKSTLGGMDAGKFDKHEAFIRAQGVEMVYVPYGAYYLGDGGCDNRFAGASDGSPALIDSEDAMSTSTAIKLFTVSNGTVGSSAQAIAATYPKGYKGFYTMKYELSQEQYVAFLNTLTYAQQKERVPGLASIKEGDYIFGNRTQPSNRNGICVAVFSFNNQPVIFANNLTNDNKYAQDNDGKTVACNYLSPNDMQGYCSWSGLRPMSELEYEKACRSIYPDPVIAKSYAWNTTTVPARLSSVNNGGQRNEVSGSNNTNVNAGNMFGPVRCGLFATSASNQQTAGASFWGVMEMSGNLKELCYNIGAATTFNGGVLGDGTYAVNKWNNTVANFGVRGGGFSSPDSVLRVSNRTEAAGYFTGLEQHDSTVTFRGVYPVAGAVTAGTIETTSICRDNIGIKSVTEASSKFNLSYLWYVLKPGSSVWEMMPGETGAAISNYVITEDFGTVVSKVYKFKRKAVALVGEATTAEVSLTVPNMKLTLSPTSAQIDACGNATKVTVTVPAAGATYQWTYNGTSLSTTNTYTPSRAHFSGGGENFTVTCTVSASGCTSEADVNVYVPLVRTVVSTAVSLSNCGSAMFNYGSDSYCTVKIGSQCWTGKNMNIGTRVAGSDYNTHTTVGIQKICYNNSTSYCDKYGGLYSWDETVNGDNVGFIKYTPGSTTQIQGICPDGWHIPSDQEWKTLEMALGMTSAQANVSGNWRGTDQGTQLKESGTFDGYNWCSGSDCNKSGFNGRPGGYRHPNSGGFYYVGSDAYFWSSTVYIGSNIWYRLLMNSYILVFRNNNYYNSFGLSVRCVKD